MKTAPSTACLARVKDKDWNNEKFSLCLVADCFAPASFAAEEAGPAPRMANGKPDLSGVWWTGGDLGSAGYGSTDRSRGLQYELYTNLYNEESKARMATLNDKDDPTLFCKANRIRYTDGALF